MSGAGLEERGAAAHGGLVPGVVPGPWGRAGGWEGAAARTRRWRRAMLSTPPLMHSSSGAPSGRRQDVRRAVRTAASRAALASGGPAPGGTGPVWAVRRVGRRAPHAPHGRGRGLRAWAGGGLGGSGGGGGGEGHRQTKQPLQGGGGGGGWHKASVSDCVPLAAPIGLSPLLILTLCGPERVLVVSTEPPDDLSCLTTPGVGRPGDGAVAHAVDQVHPEHWPPPAPEKRCVWTRGIRRKRPAIRSRVQVHECVGACVSLGRHRVREGAQQGPAGGRARSTGGGGGLFKF